MKYIVVTGGIISGIGKGITASSIGLLLQFNNYKVTAIKIDPYLNVDSGLLSPIEHGETFCLADGGECDLDLGNYERFLNINLTRDNNLTTGKIYESVIKNERAGKYLGKTVQIVPHITNEIIKRIENIATLDTDICIIEVGGTIGDMEIYPFIEAISQMAYNKKNTFCFVHVVMAINPNNEIKTKPIQHSVSKLKSLGINPNILVVRNETLLTDETIEKLQMFCQLEKENIISNINVPNIYYVPKLFIEQKVDKQILNFFGLPPNINNTEYTNYQNIIKYYENKTLVEKKICIVGKYTSIPDTYLSLVRSIEHAAIHLEIKVIIDIIDSDSENVIKKLETADAVIIAGGFGSRGIDGKLLAIKYCRENKIPILGICLGMQLMAIDIWLTQNKEGASTEYCPNTSHKIVCMLEDQDATKLGGTMRLGNYNTQLVESRVSKLYNKYDIVERHRHRYEVNNKYVRKLEDYGLKFVGKSTINGHEYMEVIELENQFYVGCQFHPEYNSKYNKPHPLFIGLLSANISR